MHILSLYVCMYVCMCAYIECTVIAIKADVTQSNEVNRAVQRIISQFSRLDILINNVGWTRDALFLRKDPQEWKKEVHKYTYIHTYITYTYIHT